MKRFSHEKILASVRPESAARIVSVLSGKGGVGKSVVAFNLAERAAAIGVRVLLVDADLNFGNIHILANAQVDYGVPQFMRGDLSLSEAAYATSFGFDILASGHTDPDEGGDATSAENLILQLRQQSAGYDLIIIDHASGVSRLATMSAYGSDINLLVLVPELTSISDCYGHFKYLKKMDAKIDCRLVVNRSRNNDEAAYVTSKLGAVCERFIAQNPIHAGTLSESDLYRKSVASQTSLAALAPEDNAVKEVSSLVEYLLASFGLTGNLANSSLSSNSKRINKTSALADIRE